MTPIGTESTQRRVVLAGTVDRGWRVALLPTRVGMYARVTEDTGGREDTADGKERTFTALGLNTRGAAG